LEQRKGDVAISTGANLVTSIDTIVKKVAKKIKGE